jgi:UDP-glucose 4-epimerase
MEILITGGAGFIGSHLAEKLLNNNHRVCIIDNLSTGSIKNIEHLKKNIRFSYEIEPIENVKITAQLVDKADIIFHLAAAVGVKLVVESPIRTIETNLKTTEIILDLASKKKKPVFVASSSEVYGKSVKIPFSEDDDMIIGRSTVGRWSYACSKAMDEFLAIAYWHERKLPVVIGRFFNTVGPRQTGSYGMVIPNMVKRALQGKDILVYGSGEQTRCFAHVDDVTSAVINLMNKTESFGQVFNIGNDEEISMQALAIKIKELTKSNSNIINIPYEDVYGSGFEDMQRRVPDLSKIKKFIGYEPKKNLEQILKDVINWMKDTEY